MKRGDIKTVFKTSKRFRKKKKKFVLHTHGKYKKEGGA